MNSNNADRDQNRTAIGSSRGTASRLTFPGASADSNDASKNYESNEPLVACHPYMCLYNPHPSTEETGNATPKANYNVRNMSSYEPPMTTITGTTIADGKPSSEKVLRNKLGSIIGVKSHYSIPGRSDTRFVEPAWKWNYDKLLDFYETHGHSNVLRSDPNPQLSGWVKRQRLYLKAGKLSPCKILLLNRLDFVWDRIDDRWYEKYDKMVEHSKKHGDCEVSTKQDRSLAEWAQRQRREYKGGFKMMTQERIKKLESLKGWRWENLRKPATKKKHKAVQDSGETPSENLDEAASQEESYTSKQDAIE